MRSCIDAALTQDYDHAAPGAGDCEGGSLNSTAPFPPPLDDASAPAPLHPPSSHPNPLQRKGGGKKGADKARRQIKRAAAKLTQPGRPRPSLSKRYPKPHAIPVDFNADSLPAAKGAFVNLWQKHCSAKE